MTMGMLKKEYTSLLIDCLDIIGKNQKSHQLSMLLRVEIVKQKRKRYIWHPMK